MPVMMTMNWDGIKSEQYESLRKSVNWEGNRPKGANFHVAAFDDKGCHVTDIWDTEEDCNAFVEQRLMPEVMKLGITTQPKVEIYPVHATYTPAYNKI